MPEDEGQSVSNPHVLRNVLMGIAIVYVAVSLYFIFDMRGRVDALERSQKTASDELARLDKGLGGTQSNLKASTEALAERLGTTEKEISARAAQLQRQQRAAEQQIKGISGITEQHQQQLSQVTGEVAGVKTDLGGTKTDLASTKSDLEATKAKLESTIGDLHVQSGLIAHTRDDLEILKHRGDRNIYEFTLTKNKRTPVSTVSLELKKTDPKKSRFTLNVLADDRTIEKKDRTLFEPMQFLTGREKNLYEVVVLSVDKNKVTGYMSTPKTATVPPGSAQ
jgi:predicted  nucleic acid-binding Zn-ribbon protein